MNNATTTAVIAAAKASPMMTYEWKGRGEAPPGYTIGMAVAFGTLYEDLKAGRDYAVRMALQSTGMMSDSLAWYKDYFGSIGGPATKSEDRLRQNAVLVTGLGMRESSGRYCCGRDTSADNKGSDTAEAGLFQMSWDIRSASPLIPMLFKKWSEAPVGDGMLAIFKQGVTPEPGDLHNWGSGDGAEFQRMCKTYPYFSVLVAAVGLRVVRGHWGPLNNHAAQIVPALDVLYRKVQAIVDAEVGGGVQDPPPPPPPPPPPVHDLKWAQAALNDLGYGKLRGALAVDGVRGPNTAAALRAFQRTAGLVMDGVFGPKTREALEAALKRASEPQQPDTPPPTGNPMYGKVYRYLIGAEVLLPGNKDEILEMPWDTDRKPALGIAVHYRNLFSEEKDAARYGPFLKGDDVAEAYEEGQIDPKSDAWMRNIADQLQVSKQLKFEYVEWDNPDAKGQKINPDVLKALDLSQALGMGVVAKNANSTDDPVLYLKHPTVVAHVVEKGCGTPDTAEAQRVAAGKPLLPTVFVYFGNTLTQAQTCARQIKSKNYKGMSVTHSPGGEYSNCDVILAPGV